MIDKKATGKNVNNVKSALVNQLKSLVSKGVITMTNDHPRLSNKDILADLTRWNNLVTNSIKPS